MPQINGSDRLCLLILPGSRNQVVFMTSAWLFILRKKPPLKAISLADTSQVSAFLLPRLMHSLAVSRRLSEKVASLISFL
jgi:hypothetical protein